MRACVRVCVRACSSRTAGTRTPECQFIAWNQTTQRDPGNRSWQEERNVDASRRRSVRETLFDKIGQ